jgi:hypothetical protein
VVVMMMMMVMMVMVMVMVVLMKRKKTAMMPCVTWASCASDWLQRAAERQRASSPGAAFSRCTRM